MPPPPTDKKKVAKRRARTEQEVLEELEEEFEEELEELEDGAGGFLPDLLRRGLTLGFTGIFLTEEAMRKAFGDSVPRDWVDFVVAQSDRTRAELVERVSREFGRVLSALDPVEVAKRLLEGRSVEVTARFRLVPDDEEPRRSAPRPPPESGAEDG